MGYRFSSTEDILSIFKAWSIPKRTGVPIVYPTAELEARPRGFSHIFQRGFPDNAIYLFDAEQPGATYIRPPANLHAMVHPNRYVVNRKEDSHAICILFNNLATGLIRWRFSYPPFA